MIERTFAQLCETGVRRRATVREMTKVTAQYQLRATAHNLTRILRKLLGTGQPRGWPSVVLVDPDEPPHLYQRLLEAATLPHHRSLTPHGLPLERRRQTHPPTDHAHEPRLFNGLVGERQEISYPIVVGTLRVPKAPHTECASYYLLPFALLSR